MEVSQGGNSQQVSDDKEMANAFGIKQEATVTPQPQPAAPSAPQKEEGSSTNPDGTGSVKADPKPTEAPKANEEQEKLFQKKAQDSHKMVIDLLEEKFSQLQNGRLDDDELRKWFDNHKEFADIANRSKRVKDRFRSLMERDRAAEHDDDLKARRTEQTRRDVKEIDDKPKENSFDGKSVDTPVTMSELQKFYAEREASLIEKQAIKVRQDQLEKFAEDHKILDDDFGKFQTTTEALFKANSEWTYEQALTAAQRALYPTKPEQVNVPHGGASGVENTESPKVDLTQPTPLFDKSEFFGRK